MIFPDTPILLCFAPVMTEISKKEDFKALFSL